MTIQLNNLMPDVLRDKLSGRDSDIWNRTLLLERGEWVKVKSPSGTGKTTLVHIIWQLRKDYSGSVWYNGEPAEKLNPEAMAQYRQQHLSIIFQDLRLFGQLTARENIELKRTMWPDGSCTAAQAEIMAEKLGVAHILHQPAAQCSYGEQQRLAIIRALVQPFDWLIMDEPFSHLDQENTRRAAALITETCTQRGAGFLLTDLDDDRHFHYSRILTL